MFKTAVALFEQGGLYFVFIIVAILLLFHLMFYKYLQLRRYRKMLGPKGNITSRIQAVLKQYLPQGKEKAELELRLFYEAEAECLQARLSTIHTLSSLLPMLGLLGTVSGIMLVFKALGFASGDYQSIAKGIGEALLNTKAGLLGSIPGLFVHHHLCDLSDSILLKLKEKCEVEILSLPS